MYLYLSLSYDRLPESVDVDTPVFLRTNSIAERANHSYSSFVTLGLVGCSLTQIVFNPGMTVNPMPGTA